MVDRAVAYVVDEARDDQLVWCSGCVPESLDVSLYRHYRIGNRHRRHFVDTETEPFSHLLLDALVGETRHSAVGVVDNDQFRLHSARPWHVGGENPEYCKICHHCRGYPAAGVTQDHCVTESKPE